MAYGVNTDAAGFGDIYALPLSGNANPIQVAHTPLAEDEPRFSWDGKWLAYNSNESGMAQVYVVSFPAINRKMQVSIAGGAQPRWRRDDKELYISGAGRRHDGCRVSPALASAAPRALFNSGLDPDPARDQYAVSPDGERFLLQLPAQDSAVAPVTVVLNWTAALRK